ncbi:GNAT family N-acetyltransferase [Bacillus sp. SD088]|uniref:GNAT family N-acetyltransferase n=1 Tax=Bacillus sp. SD088 TaxID=2782012 RepID=UPI001A960DA4|nr:GNAT family N-acetyltransferase [Bacillus sp. SD088]MBO0991806.1 GNAT family N-acetyltransferase [Bacillus sp. SD088]
MTVEIRLATANDAEELSILNQEFNGGARRPILKISESLMKNSELVAVAVRNNRLVGFACAQISTSFCYEDLFGEITEMYVKEIARHKGIATSLLEFLEKRLCAHGVKEIKILTGAKNVGAIRTYTKSNYITQDEVVFLKAID